LPLTFGTREFYQTNHRKLILLTGWGKLVKLNANVKHSLKTAETDALKIALLSRGISVSGLADSVGLKTVTIQNEFSKNFPSRRLRMLVESVLGIPIWTSGADFERRRSLTKKLGFNPFTTSMSGLRQEARRRKLPGRSLSKSREDLIHLLSLNTSTQSPSQNPSL
jgi:hypothetical protein